MRNLFKLQYPELPLDEFYEKGIFWISFSDFCKYFHTITICDFDKQKYVRRFYNEKFYNKDSNSFIVYDIDVLKYTTVYLELFHANDNLKRNDLALPDLGLIVLKKSDKDPADVSYNLVGNRNCVLNFRAATTTLNLQSGTYKIIPISFRYWNNPNIENNFNFVIHNSETINLEKKLQNSKEFPISIFATLSTSESNLMSRGCATFIYGHNNEESKYLRITVKIFSGHINCKDKKTRKIKQIPTNLDKTHPLYEFENEKIDEIPPNHKKISCILIDNADLQKKNLEPNYKYLDQKNTKFEIKEDIILDSEREILENTNSDLHNNILQSNLKSDVTTATKNKK